MNMKRAMMIAVLAVAVAALAVPLVGLNARAAGSAANIKPSVAAAKANAADVSRAASQNAQQQETQQETTAATQSAGNGKISAETLKALGVRRLPTGVTPKDVASLLSRKITHGNAEAQVRIGLPPGTGPGGASPVPVPGPPKSVGAQGPPLAGEPLVLNELSALSAALITTIGGRDNQFSEVALIADWDGR